MTPKLVDVHVHLAALPSPGNGCLMSRRMLRGPALLSLPNRVGALLRIRRRPELFERLVFGTDYPLPCYAYPALLGGWGPFRAALSAGNRFDRQARMLGALGVCAGADARSILASSF